MKVNSVSSQNFQSRNQTIRFADDIARRVNTCYPRLSSTTFIDLENSGKFKNSLDKLDDRINKMRMYKYDLFDYAKDVVGKSAALIYPIQRYHCGNCGESAHLSAIAAKLNGIRNCYPAMLITKEGKNLDHAVLLVKGEKPYIIDSWLGFADYVPNAMIRFKSEFLQHFDCEPNSKLELVRPPKSYDSFLNRNFDEKDIEKLRTLMPEVVIKKRNK